MEKNALEGLGLIAAVALAPSAIAVVIPRFDQGEAAPRATGPEPGIRAPLYLLDRHLLI